VKRTQKAAVPPNTRRLKDFFLYLGASVGVNIKVAASAVQPKERSDKAGEGGQVFFGLIPIECQDGRIALGCEYE